MRWSAFAGHRREQRPPAQYVLYLKHLLRRRSRPLPIFDVALQCFRHFTHDTLRVEPGSRAPRCRMIHNSRFEIHSERIALIELCRRYPLTVYFIIAYAGSWHAWALFLLSRNGSGFLPLHSPASFMVLMGLGTFSGPTIGAFIVTAATKGREGVVELLRRIVQWRVRVLWYVFAFLDLPVIQTLGAIAIPGVASTTTQSMSCLREWLRQRSSFFPRCLQVPWVRRSAGEGLRFASSSRKSWASIGEFDPRYLVGLLAHADLVQRSVVRTEPPRRRRLCILDHGGIVHFYLGLQQYPGQRVHGHFAPCCDGCISECVSIGDLPETRKLTSGGVLSMYLGLSLGFGIVALLLLVLTRGRLGYVREI